VKVDDQYNGNYYYTVELFDAHPLFDENATLLGKGVAKLKNDFSASVVLPIALERIYVQQTDPTGGKQSPRLMLPRLHSRMNLQRSQQKFVLLL